MTLPLRAFLMVRSGLENWTVDVCRDLDAVTGAWERRSDASLSAVLHVGFDRPPSTAFEEVAASHPGRMLLTASARYAVPKQFETSDNPVGMVEHHPVYLGLKGWGYIETDVSMPELKNPEASAQRREFSDWLVGFVEARPEFSGDLISAEVTSEASYQVNESSLPWEARYRSGLYRYGHLMTSEDSEPCAIVRAAPPWVRARKLDGIDLTVRLRNVFQRAQFVSVSDIGQVEIGDLFRMANFGRTSARDLRKILLDTMAEGPRSDAGEGAVSQPGTLSPAPLATLLAELHRTLALCEPRERDILVRRMGLGCQAETLQGVAADYNITRERVRQIEAKATKRIIRKADWDDVLTTKMEGLLANRDYPLPVLGLEAVDAWFEGISDEIPALGYVLSNFCGDRVSISEIAGVQYIGFLTQDEWQVALAEGAHILKYAGDRSWSEAHIQSLLRPTLPERAREFRSLLWTELAKLCHFSSNASGEKVLVSFGRGLEHAVEALLADVDVPLHYSEIAERLGQRLAKSVDVRRAHNAAANVGILLGRGIYGAEKHLNVTSGYLERLADESSAMILNGPAGRQWHSAELLEGLIERGFAGDNLNKYVVDYALRRASGLTRLGRMTWTADEHCALGDRIEIREAVQSLVWAAGRPLTTAEIRQRLVALRGVNDTFQFSFSDPLIRVGPGLWGLNDRDVPVARKDQRALIDHLIDKLMCNGLGMHTSEVSAQLDRPWSDISPQIVFSLAILDERLRVSVGQFLYLTEWTEPRRETIFQIVQRVVENTSGHFTTNEIVSVVERESTLPIDTSQVSACIRSAGATYDAISRSWLADQRLDDLTIEQAG